jgi:hypothetical protein
MIRMQTTTSEGKASALARAEGLFSLPNLSVAEQPQRPKSVVQLHMPPLEIAVPACGAAAALREP